MLDSWKRLVVVAVLLVTVSALGTAAPAPADHDTQSTTTTFPESQGIIPEPNTGVAPADAGDRGGALQSVLFVAILGGMAVIGYFAVRESRRVRAERGF